MLAETERAASSVIEAFHGLDQNILIQKFIKEAKGADIRALVVGRKVVGAMRRQAVAGEFRSNLHRGGSATKIRLPAEYRKTALAAARVLGLRMAGVDMLESKDGPMIMEVNSSPGLEGIEKATGVDVAGAVIEHPGARGRTGSGRVTEPSRVMPKPPTRPRDLSSRYSSRRTASRRRPIRPWPASSTAVGPCTLRPNPDLFHILTQTVISQQISTKAAVRSAEGSRNCSAARRSAAAVLARTDDELRSAGLSTAKLRSIRAIAARVADGTLDLARLAKMSDAEVAAALRSITGFGPWSVDMVLIFGLGRLDVLPVGDLGFRFGVRDWLRSEGGPVARGTGKYWRTRGGLIERSLPGTSGGAAGSCRNRSIRGRASSCDRPRKGPSPRRACPTPAGRLLLCAAGN